jgi:tRNA1Val (adenine37-N6)-methyltransferase
MADQGAVTADTFFNGRLKVHQARDGYRFSIDAVLLADAVHPKAGQSIIDLGTGCGIIPLILAFRYPGVVIHGVEMQTELAELADLNVTANGLQDRIQVIHKDVRRLNHDDTQGLGDWIIANPPYRRPLSGRINPNSQKALARHEIALDLAQLIQTAKRMLKTRGRLATIYPAERITDLLTGMRSAAIEPKWLRGIYSHEGEAAKLVLVQGVKAGRPGLTLAPPLVIYQDDGAYTPVVQAMFQG